MRLTQKLGGVAKALANHAEAVYNQLNQIEQKQVQQIFLPLVHLGEGTEDTRRLSTRAEVGHWKLVTSLAGEKARLVVTGRNEDTEEETVQVVHEALIREWKRLREWISENREKLRQKRKIETAAKEWEEKRKSKDYLFSGKQVTDAKVFRKARSENLALSNRAREFIQKSIRKQLINRLRLIVLGLIFPFCLTVVMGVVVLQEIQVRRLWQTVDATQGQVNSQARINALQELVNFRVSLQNINLSEANLSDADLSGANLTSSTFTGANLSYVNLHKARLIVANLSRANLNRVLLEDADLYHSDLSYAILSHARLFGAKLEYVNFSSADLSNAALAKASLKYANFRNANLRNANFDNADLFYADFRDAQNITPEQVKTAQNWSIALYDKALCVKLGVEQACEGIRVNLEFNRR